MKKTAPPAKLMSAASMTVRKSPAVTCADVFATTIRAQEGAHGIPQPVFLQLIPGHKRLIKA
jgi:hypothetical protein